MQLKDLWAQVYSDPLDLWVLWPEETDEEDEEDEEGVCLHQEAINAPEGMARERPESDSEGGRAEEKKECPGACKTGSKKWKVIPNKISRA